MRRFHYKIEEFEQAFKELKVIFNSTILSKLEREFEILYSLLPKNYNSTGHAFSSEMKQICYLVFFQEYFHQAGVEPTNSSDLYQKLGGLKQQIGLQKFEDELDDILHQYRMNLFRIMGQLETAWLLFIIALQLVQERIFTEEEFDLMYMEFSSTDGPIYHMRFFYERANVFLIGGYGIGDFYSTDVFSTI